MAKNNLWLGILVLVFVFGMSVVGCASQKIVTQETYKDLGHDTFSTFRFYISKDVVLKEIVPLDRATDKRNTRETVTAHNREVRIKRSTAGRVQEEASLKHLEIAFEKLRDGTRPPIAFVQKNNDGRYYFEYTIGNWRVTDKKGNLVSVNGPSIKYNGTYYLLQFKRKGGEPYLLYEQVVKVKNKSRNMRGLR